MFKFREVIIDWIHIMLYNLAWIGENVPGDYTKGTLASVSKGKVDKNN